MADEYYAIGPTLSDVDFYIGGIEGSAFSFINTSLEVSSKKIAYASSSVSIQSNISSVMMKETEAQSQASILSTTAVGVLSIINPQVYIQSEMVLQAALQKIVFTQVSSNITLNSSTTADKITNANSFISIHSQSQQQAIKIAKASGNSSISSSAQVLSKSLVLAVVFANSSLNVNLKPPIRFSSSYIDQTSIRTLFVLDDKPLTNHNRQVDVSIAPVNTEIINWNNKKNRYYRRVSSSGRKTFNFKWTMLPNSMEYTVDHRNGRDYILHVAEDPDVHYLKIINNDEDGVTPYSETEYQVFVRSYSENLIRRYVSEGVYLYECNLVLEEA